MKKSLSSFDPSLRAVGNSGEGQLIAHHSLRIRMRLPEEDAGSGRYIDAGTEVLLCKIISFYEDEFLRMTKIELLSETDIFFYYLREIYHTDFRNLKENQQLNVDYPSFPALLADLAGRCSSDQQQDIQCSLTLIDASRARLDFVSLVHAFRHTELFSIELDAADIEQRDLLVSFRYNEIRRRLSVAEDRYRDLATAVRQRYPQLATTNSTTATPTAAGAPVTHPYSSY